MKRLTNRSSVTVIAILYCASFVLGQDAPAIKQIGIGDVTATHAVQSATNMPGQSDSLNHMVDSLNQHMLVEFQRTNKFKVIVKQDLAKILEDQGVASGSIRDPEDKKSLPGKIKGLDYLVLCAITDFKDMKQGIEIKATAMRVDQRIVQATMIMKIYDTTTGELVSAMDIPMRQEEKGPQRAAADGYGNNAPDAAMIEGLVKDLSHEAALRVVDAIYPPKIAQITGGVVYINRGEGSGVELGQMWTALTTGAEIKDPDTGRVIGKEEVEVADVRITEVLPSMSKGMIVGDNRGAAAGAILRFRTNATPPSINIPNSGRAQ